MRGQQQLVLIIFQICKNFSHALIRCVDFIGFIILTIIFLWFWANLILISWKYVIYICRISNFGKNSGVFNKIRPPENVKHTTIYDKSGKSKNIEWFYWFDPYNYICYFELPNLILISWKYVIYVEFPILAKIIAFSIKFDRLKTSSIRQYMTKVETLKIWNDILLFILIGGQSKGKCLVDSI